MEFATTAHHKFFKSRERKWVMWPREGNKDSDYIFSFYFGFLYKKNTSYFLIQQKEVTFYLPNPNPKLARIPNDHRVLSFLVMQV